MVAAEQTEQWREWEAELVGGLSLELVETMLWPGENGFTFGRLQALEEARAAALERDYPRLLESLPTPKLSRWLDS